ncbi:MAG TPA: hypothetical protein DHV26_00610 [Cytophagales bacterium]|nr:hypothetical protein [Cytophagales bacterium]
MRAILLLGLLLIALPEATAQICTEIKGIVIDEKQQSLPRANIYLQSNWRVGTSTDSLGSFILPPVNQPDTVVISFVGYKELFIPVSTSTCTLTIVMESLITQTGEVTVMAERLIAEEFRTFKATKLQIYTNPAARADPLLAVNSMPAATTLDESANISLRGSTAQETGIFLNNVPIYDGVRYSQLNGIGTFSIFNTAIIDNVQVYPGNPPLEYGNASSGLIALQTDNNIPEKSNTQLSVTLANIGVNTHLRTGKTSSLTVFSNYQYSNLLTNLNRKAFERIKKFNTTDLGIHYNRQWANTSLRIFNYSLRESFTYDFRHPSFQGDFYSGKTRNFSTISLQHKLGAGELSLNQGLSFGRSGFNYSASDITITSRDFYTSLNYYYKTAMVDFKTGISSDNRRQNFSGSIATLAYALGPQHPHQHAQSTTNIPITEAYGYTKIILSEKFIAGAGIRKKLIAQSIPDYTSLQANFKWQPTDAFSSIFGVGQYHRTDFSRSGENPIIQYKNSQLSLDLSYNKKHYELSVSGFVKRSDQTDQSQNINGLEFFARYKKSKFSGQLSFTTLQASIKKEETNPSPYDLGYFIKSNVQYRFNQSWTVSLFATGRQGTWYQPVVSSVFDPQWKVRQPMYSDATNSKRLPDYFSLSGNISRMFTLSDQFNLIAFISAENITNHLNVRSYTYNFDYSLKGIEQFTQRTFFIGCVLNF